MIRPLCISLFALTALACGSEGGRRGDDAGTTPGRGNADEAESGGDCIEQVSPLVADESALGRQAQQLLALATGERSAELTWRGGDGSTTRLTLQLSDAKAQQVDSRVNPEARGEIERDCADRVRILAKGVLRTADGRLDETISEIAFNAIEQDGLSAWFSHKRADLRGTYAEHATAPRGELSSIYFALELKADTFAGSLSEEFTTSDSVGLGASVAQWSATLPMPDAATPSSDDAGRSDAGSVDAGRLDAGEPKDPDAGASDAGRADASSLRGCYGDGECASLPGTKCSAVTECLSPPGCGGAQACPAVCYGYCK
jgi:hypothetical protein